MNTCTSYPLPEFGLIGVHKKFSTIFLELTSKCHNKCIFCVTGRNKKNNGTMSFADLQYVLQTIPNFNGKTILHLGGEAFILKDLPEKCEFIKKFWPSCRLHLTTTFNIKRDRNYLERLLNSGLDSLTISCYGYTNDDYLKIHGYNGFQNLCKNISILQSIKHTVRISLKAMDNIEKIAQITNHKNKFEFFKKFLKDHNIENLGHSRGDNRQGRLNNLIQQSTSNLMQWPCDVVWGTRAGELIIGWNLDILPCCAVTSHDMVLGNLRENSIETIYKSDKYVSFYNAHMSGNLDNYPLCKTCDTKHRIASDSELMRFTSWQASSLKNKSNIYFWGNGAAWRKFGIFFNCYKPDGFIQSQHNETKADTFNGIPVYKPEEVILKEKAIVLVIFAYPPNNKVIASYLSKEFPWIKPKNLIWVPSIGQSDAWNNEKL